MNHKSKLQRRYPVRAIILTAVILTFWGLSRDWVLVKQVECYTQYGFCDQELLHQAEWLKATPLLFPLPREKLIVSFSEFPQVKSVNLYRRLPSTLVVKVDLRKPIGLVGPEVLGVSSLADSDGVIFGQQSQSPLPQLIISQPVGLGDKLSPAQIKALQILSGVSNLVGDKTIGRIDNDRLVILISNSTQVVFDIDDLPSGWARTLQLILDRSKIQAKVPKLIDLRFSSPILTF